MRCPRWAKERSRGAEPSPARTALSGRLCRPPAGRCSWWLWAGAAAGASPSPGPGAAPSLPSRACGHPRPTCSLRLALHYAGASGPVERGDFPGRSSRLALPSGRAGLAARAAGAPRLGGGQLLLMGWAHVAGLVQVVPWAGGRAEGGQEEGPPVSLTTGHAGAPGRAAPICKWVYRRVQKHDVFSNRILITGWFWVVTRLNVTLRCRGPAALDKKLPESRWPRSFRARASLRRAGLLLAMLSLLY